jgi:ElaB/YqjD/DUF883 family membrane-anchored ribosome-binding protein
MQRVNTDRLIRDLHEIVADAEELIRAVAGNASEAVAAARARIDESLHAAKEHWPKTKRDATKGDELGPQTAGPRSRADIWKLMAIAAGAGMLAGLIISRTSESRRPQDD